jgi:hypothetical protein
VGCVRMQVGRPFVILSGLVQLATSLIACNLKCNPWHENKVLTAPFCLLGGFHSVTCTNVM